MFLNHVLCDAAALDGPEGRCKVLREHEHGLSACRKRVPCASCVLELPLGHIRHLVGLFGSFGRLHVCFVMGPDVLSAQICICTLVSLPGFSNLEREPLLTHRVDVFELLLNPFGRCSVAFVLCFDELALKIRLGVLRLCCGHERLPV